MVTIAIGLKFKKMFFRETWGNPKLKDSVTRLVFILGKFESWHVSNQFCSLLSPRPWTPPLQSTFTVNILGKGSNEDLQKNITRESEKYGDIIQGDFIDVYRNISYKAVRANLWVSEFCEQAEFVVKTDDDMFVDLYEVYTLTRGYLSSSYYTSNR